MKVSLTEEFTFEAAHRIRKSRSEYGQIHGHTHRVFVTISGDPDPVFGWIMDQAEFRSICNRVIEKLDHRYLNEIMDLTTAEAIAVHLFKLIDKNLPGRVSLDKVGVGKTSALAIATR